MKNVAKLFILMAFFTIIINSCNKKNPTENDNLLETGTLIDIDGNVYMTVKIGDQWWMAENLKVTHYLDGTAITKATSRSSAWTNLTAGCFCAYEFNESYANTYGYLYNWYTIGDSRGLAPEGWHVPTVGEWEVLISNLGGEGVAGGKMKEAGLSHWASNNSGATNESGFTALPGGYRAKLSGDGSSIRELAYFWAATNGSDYANYYYIKHSYDNIFDGEKAKAFGYSIRLIKDSN